LNRETGSRAVGYWTVVLGVFAILAASHLFVLWVGWSRSVDVKGWWPLILAWGATVSFLYAVAFSGTVRVGGRADTWFVVGYNVALAALLAVNGYMAYTVEIDWLAVNSGAARLTVLQQVVQSSITPFAIYGTFLLIAILWGLVRRSGTDARLAGVAVAVSLLFAAAYRLTAYGYYLDATGLGPDSPFIELLWLNLLVAFTLVGAAAATVVERRRSLLVLGFVLLAMTIMLQLVVTLLAP